jgi:hypothetical protein
VPRDMLLRIISLRDIAAAIQDVSIRHLIIALNHKRTACPKLVLHGFSHHFQSFVAYNNIALFILLIATTNNIIV